MVNKGYHVEDEPYAQRDSRGAADWDDARDYREEDWKCLEVIILSQNT
jgi:hypothetical protein